MNERLVSAAGLGWRDGKDGGWLPPVSFSWIVARTSNPDRLERVLLTDFFVAASEDAEAIAAGTFGDPDHRTENADNSVLAGLWAALDETSDSRRLGGEEFLIAMGSTEGPWVFGLPDEMTARLSELPEAEFIQIADRWARSEELSFHGVSGSDMVAALTILHRLAEQAQSKGSSLLLRMTM